MSLRSRKDNEKDDEPKAPRPLRSVRKRHILIQRPALPSFGQLDTEESDTGETRSKRHKESGSVVSNDAESSSTSPTSFRINVRPPTQSSSSEATHVRSQQLPTPSPSPQQLRPAEDPATIARRERRRKRKEILDMPLPDIPQPEPEPIPVPKLPKHQPVPQRSLDSKPVQYLPQEHLFEVAEREIRRTSVGSTDTIDDSIAGSVLSLPCTEAPSESEIPLGAVHCIIHSHRYREKLSEMLNLNSSAGEAPNFAKVYEATAKDEQKVADLFEDVLSSEAERSVALSLRGVDAESFMDALQQILDENKQCSIAQDDTLRSATQDLLIQLSKRSTNLPESMFISGVEPVKEKRYLGGTFGDVYRSVYEGKLVALKMLRTFQGQNERTKIYKLHQIIQGVDYLHSQGVVHGDLKGTNILIDENCNPRLADFGLTVFAEATMQSTTDHGGTLRWMAPELLYSHGEPQRRSHASDIYAFACVCVEVYTGSVPFAEVRNEGAVITQIVQGVRPKRPEKMTSDSLWKIVKVCWQADQTARPKSRKVANALRELLKNRKSVGGVDSVGRDHDQTHTGLYPGPREGLTQRRPFTPFATIEDHTLQQYTAQWFDQDAEDEYAQCAKRLRHHADPHRLYHHLQLLQQNSSVNLFTGRVKGTNTIVTVKQVDFNRQSGLVKRLSRLIDEFHDMRFLHHPNIVNYVDLFQHENHVWIVMDSIKESVPLSKLLERATQSGGLKESFLANVIRHVVQAVHYLHRHGIVHGSISSEHILLGTGKNLTAKLKLCAMIDDPDMSSQRRRLSAPESRGEETNGPEGDIWCLGLLGIELWDTTIDLTRERADLLLDVLQNSTPPTAPMRSYLNQTLHSNPTLRPTAANLLQHPFLSNLGTARSALKNASGLNRSLTDPRQRQRGLDASSAVRRSRTFKK
ncbi:hypothetical protein V5O48_004981 [Marasmius crinis-equi]|uniref:Protein kinase domain-containing protein n=1 Tax=Marasmius crinis-equi TaxID=585013 RepID=A0ABR3FNK5_9AGAR